MTSSPDPIASWTPPELGGVLEARRQNRGPAGRPRATDDRPGLADAVDPAMAAASAWTLPEFATHSHDAREVSRTPEDEAYALGFADGTRQGEARALENLRPVLDALFKTMEQIEASRARFEHDRERNLRGLALAVAHQLLQREVAADPTVVLELVQRALELMPPNTPFEVRLHPADLVAIGPELEKLAGAGRVVPIEWSADPSLLRGGFVIEGPQRLIDGRTDTALRSLFERLEHD
jgi:flagellar biosynthesis/type III secretory pathway protein FliH